MIDILKHPRKMILQFWVKHSSHFKSTSGKYDHQETESKWNNLHQYPKCKLPTECAKCSFLEKSSAWVCTEYLNGGRKKKKKKNLAIFTSLLRLPRETICVCQGWGSSGVSSSRLGRSLVPHKFGGILESDKTDGTPLLLCFRDIRTSSSSIQPHNCHTLNYPK